MCFSRVNNLLLLTISVYSTSGTLSLNNLLSSFPISGLQKPKYASSPHQHFKRHRNQFLGKSSEKLRYWMYISLLLFPPKGEAVIWAFHLYKSVHLGERSITIVMKWLFLPVSMHLFLALSWLGGWHLLN